MTCRICSSSSHHTPYLFRERMFGLGDEFQYFQCSNCGCLQIASPPANLSRYYPENYYSFFAKPLPQRGLKSYFATKRDVWSTTGKGTIGRLISWMVPAGLEAISLAAVPAEKAMSILDVGCGSGSLLSLLWRAGFKRLLGIDPFVPNDFEILPGLSVRKTTLDRVSGQFDLIMMHHVFEHLPDGGETLQLCRQRLRPAGKILLRFPTAQSEGWKSYRENWVGVDAPRHLFLHTKSSFEMLAETAGLKVEKWFCDSSANYYWLSELLVRNIPLCDPAGAAVAPQNYFSQGEMRSFQRRAKQANAVGLGDQVVAVLTAR
jgi:2-polyprenyl-3-methyl-5-hydroxy-6-metoxy-1,4-benzoquinol methylase